MLSSMIGRWSVSRIVSQSTEKSTIVLRRRRGLCNSPPASNRLAAETSRRSRVMRSRLQAWVTWYRYGELSISFQRSTGIRLPLQAPGPHSGLHWSLSCPGVAVSGAGGKPASVLEPTPQELGPRNPQDGPENLGADDIAQARPRLNLWLWFSQACFQLHPIQLRLQHRYPHPQVAAFLVSRYLGAFGFPLGLLLGSGFGLFEGGPFLGRLCHEALPHLVAATFVRG